MYKNIYLSIFILLFLISCAQKEIKKTEILEKSLELQVLEAYEEGMKALNSNDVLYAAKKFNETEILFPQSEWAPKSSLMAAYAYYNDEYYNDTIYEVERFLKTYPTHQRTDYAYYLLAVTHYNLIVDETNPP